MRIVYSEAKRIKSLYRPFIVKHHFAESTTNDVLTNNHRQMFGEDLRQPNSLVNMCVNGKDFYALATDRLTDLHFVGDTRCLPLYRYTSDGERVSNITAWGMQQFHERYCDASISAEDIFAYTYAVLHDPVYRQRYAADLLREFPRLPLYDDFGAWADVGQRLLDLHLGFERADRYPLKREDTDIEASIAKLRADRERGIIALDDRTRLSGVPAEAWRYQLGERSALEWVLNQHKRAQKPRDHSIISAGFNNYRFADHKEQVMDLLRRVCTVSVRTMELVNEMEAMAR